MQYNITFFPTPGSFGTLIEYRENGSSVWVTPNSPANPTMLSYFPLELDPNKQYYIRVTAIGQDCANSSTIISLVTPTTNNCCPVGYTLSEDETYCYQVSSVSATAPTAPQNLAARTNKAYGTCGTRIYDLGFNVNGTGSSTLISFSNTFWVNGNGSCVDDLSLGGPLNRCGVWSTSTSSNQQVGFSVCIDVPATKTYYIGVGCDNYSTIRIDGNTIIDQDEAALATFYGGLGGATFKIWHIYPVEILSGQHIIEVIGNNVSSVAGFGTQIYDNTPSEIINATTNSELNFIFNSSDYVGQPVTIGNVGAGYTCPPGYSLDICEIPYRCVNIVTTNTISC